jgi:5-hydroxyisourate hydrolase
MGKLSTHILDTSLGQPARGVRVDLYHLVDDRAELLKTITSNNDGRSDEPLLSGGEFTVGKYRLLFHVGAYFSGKCAKSAPDFLDVVPVDFIVGDAAATYHVPLLVSPWSYTTYRGS